ncbi:MFS transporter [Microbacterium sp. NPDC077663]|uniref:MFS transporter n=1 Tax=Microbacterium sp. NPDC077663 TaxID=3364189 RepID=UPI0037C61984
MTTSALATKPSRSPARVWWSAFAGSAMEFYDFSVYSAASAVILGPLFFNEAEPAIATILSFATLAIGYVARPIGAVVWGHFGDRIGRKSVLIWTMIVMAIATLGIGVLPTASDIGSLAPVLLVVLRLVQGFAVGGEWGGSVTLATEHSGTKRRAFAGAATAAGASAGYSIGFGVFALVAWLAGDAIADGWWRVPFLLTVVMFAIALFLRLRVEETPIMKAMLESNERVRVPIAVVFGRHWRQVIIGVFVVAGMFATSQAYVGFLVAYGVSNLGYTAAQMLLATTISAGLNVFAGPIASLIADKLGRRTVVLTGIGLLALLTVFMWPLMHTGLFGIVLLTFCLMYTIYGLTYGPVAGILTELFPTQIRYSGISIAYQLASIIGGTTSLVCSALIAGGLGEISIVLYIFLLLAVSAVALLFVPKHNDTDLANVARVGKNSTAQAATS